MICAICSRQSRGFGYVNPHFSLFNPKRDATRRRFCSMRCLDIYTRLQKSGGCMIDPTAQEKAAMEAVLKPLGEYVGSIGMHRALADYTREEALTLIEVAVTAYQDHLRDACQESAA